MTTRRPAPEHRRPTILAAFGGALVAAATVLVFLDKNAGFASAIALAGVFCVVLGLMADRLEQLGGGGLTAKLLKQRAEEVEELATEKESGRDVVDLAEPELPTASRFLATMRSLAALLRPHEGPLAGCVLHLYTFDESAGLLIPTYEPDPAKAPGSWAPGIGVTGQAYATDSFVLATGEHTHNSTHGLSDEEQARHADLLEVAALPVTNAAGNTIAVLAASNRVSPGILSSTDGYEELVALAEAIARVLIDLLGGFEDD